MPSRRLLALALAAALPALALGAAPAGAQPAGLPPAIAAVIQGVDSKESALFQKQNAPAIAALFTADALHVGLAPALAVAAGRAEIQKHYEAIFHGGAVGLSSHIEHVSKRGAELWVVESYAVKTAKGTTIRGNLLHILRHVGKEWQIALEAYARPDIAK